MVRRLGMGAENLARGEDGVGRGFAIRLLEVLTALLVVLLGALLVAAAAGCGTKDPAAHAPALALTIRNDDASPLAGVRVWDSPVPHVVGGVYYFTRSHGHVDIPPRSSVTIFIRPIPHRIAVVHPSGFPQHTRSRGQDYTRSLVITFP